MTRRLPEMEPEIVSEFPPHIQTAVAVSKIAQQKGFNFVIAGGTAFDLLTAGDLRNVPQRKENGKYRDVDIILDSRVPKKIFLAAVEEQLPEKSNFLDFSLSNIVYIEDGRAQINYNGISASIHLGVFTPVTISLDGVSLPVLRPQTLQRIFKITHDEVTREKDLLRLQELERSFEKFPLPFDERHYKVFDQFRDLVNERYPLTRILRQMDVGRSKSRLSFVKLLHLLPGGRSVTKLVRENMLKMEKAFLDDEKFSFGEPEKSESSNFPLTSKSI